VGIDIDTLVDLVTFPYHNAYAVGSAVRSAASAGVQVLGLPLSLGYYLLTNASDETIQKYLTGVQTNANNAIPNIFKAIQNEINYNKELFDKVFGGSTTLASSDQKATAPDAKSGTATDGADLKTPLGASGSAGEDDNVPAVGDAEQTTGANDEEGAGDSEADPAAGTKPAKHDFEHGFDLAAAVKALGGSLSGIGKHAQNGAGDTKQDDTKQDDTKQDDTKQDDTKQDDTKQDDSKQDAGQSAAKAGDNGAGETGGRHRLAG
jgi:hypothetical protein